MIKKNTRTKNYAPTVQAELDLHGYTTQEARDAVDELLWEARAHEWTRVRIIVGKGTRSEGGVAVLPNAVKALLTQRGYMYTYAKIRDGGEGALEVTFSK